MALLLADLAEIAAITGGIWWNARDCPPLTGFSVRVNSLARKFTGNVYALEKRTDGLPEPVQPPERLIEAFAAGAVAAIVPRQGDYAGMERPLLMVDNVRAALASLAAAGRARYPGRCVLVTGSAGKTGFKCMLGHVLLPQFRTRFMRNSLNSTGPINASLASLRSGDEMLVLEVAVAGPDRGWQRSRLVRPHLCVITEVAAEHLNLHKSLEALIAAKAAVVDGLEPGGACLLNGDSATFEPLRRAVLARRVVPLAVFGHGQDCDGRVLEADFDGSGWRIRSRTDGHNVSFRIPLVGEHVPAAATGVLLAAARLGADLDQAAEAFATYRPIGTQGKLRSLRPAGGGRIQVLDFSQRATLLSYRSALATLRRFAPEGGRRIGVIGELRNLGDYLNAASREVAALVGAAGFDRIYLVGANAEVLRDHLPDPAKVVTWFPRYEDTDADFARQVADMAGAVAADLADGDLLFIKGEIEELGLALRHITEA